MSGDTTRPADTPPGEERRACNACDWRGPISATLMLSDHAGGGVGPLCPECHETTDVAPAGLARIDADYWLARRAEIIDALTAGGWQIMSDARRVWLRRTKPAAPAALADALRQCVVVIDRADTSTGVCGCGESMDRHTPPMDAGHMPADIGDVQAERAIADARAALAGQAQEPAVMPSEAIYGFAAWLTCLDAPVTLGASHDAAPAADLVEQYRLSQDWAPPRPNYTGSLKMMPAGTTFKPQPVDAPAGAQPQEPAREPSDEQEADARDAARYRALRDTPNASVDVSGVGVCRGDRLDWAADLMLQVEREPSDEELTRMWIAAEESTSDGKPPPCWVRFARAVRAWKPEENGRG